MTIDIWITKARNKANEPGIAGHISNTELVDAFNRAQDMVSSLILESDEAYYDVSDQSIGWVANTEEYNLPRPIASRKITKVTRTDLSMPSDLRPIRFQEKNEYELPGSAVNPSDRSWYYLRGEKIGFKPTPKQTVSLNILLNYQQLPHEVHWAQAKTPTTTTFIMPTNTSITPYLKAGRVALEADYYVGARVRFITGASAGLEIPITAYDPATQTVTFAAITGGQVTNITNADYVILSPHAKEYQHAGMWAMVVDLAIKKKDIVLKEFAQGEMNAVLNKIRENVTPRTTDYGRYVRPPADWDY